MFDSSQGLFLYADWCNSNITDSWSVDIGANPLSAHTYTKIDVL